MEQRLIEIVLPEGKGDDIPELLHERSLNGYWRDTLEGKQARIRILLNSPEVEPVLDILEPYLEKLPAASAVLLIVEASIPRPRVALSTTGDTTDHEKGGDEESSHRISRQELYADIVSGSGISSTYLLMVVLSAVIAAIGLLRNDMAIIIGAMVLAPLLMPNVALALASTLGDKKLAAQGFKAAAAGFIMAVTIGAVIGFLFPAEVANPAIAARTSLHWTDLVLALASGAAGVLAFTSGGQLSLIGVMVAVALMPPLVTAGLLAGNGQPVLGLKALQLAGANIICVNLAGIITFTIQGIRPATWWEKAKAQRARKRAIKIWIVLLSLLALMIFH